MYVKVESESHIRLLEGLAKEIWTTHFGPMFDNDTLEYIINKIQSKEAISKQIEEGCSYYIIYQDRNIPVGYFAFYLSRPENELFLSKLYIRSSERRKGLGKQVVSHLEEVCKENDITKITLTVYHMNQSAIDAYESLDFNQVGYTSKDIGNGIALNDCIMEKTV